jgi:hypothetical protein
MRHSKISLGVIQPFLMDLKLCSLMEEDIKVITNGNIRKDSNSTGGEHLIILKIKAVKPLSLMVSTQLISSKVDLLIATS